MSEAVVIAIIGALGAVVMEVVRRFMSPSQADDIEDIVEDVLEELEKKKEL